MGIVVRVVRWVVRRREQLLVSFVAPLAVGVALILLDRSVPRPG